MRGWISAIKNPAIPGMIKLSRSDDDPDVLIKKLDASGGSPSRYQLVYRVYVSNSFLILQNIRRSLLTRHKGGISGWYALTDSEGITIIRNEVAQYLIDRFLNSITNGDGNNDFATMTRIIDSVLFLSENRFQERNSINEAREIAIVMTSIMKDKNWFPGGTWLNRITLNNPIFAIRN